MKKQINAAIGFIEKAIAQLKEIETPPEDIQEVISDLECKIADLDYVKYKRFQEEQDKYVTIKV